MGDSGGKMCDNRMTPANKTAMGGGGGEASGQSLSNPEISTFSEDSERISQTNPSVC